MGLRSHVLAPTYNKSIRIVAGLLPSTPADAACVELGTLPFRYKLAETICSRAISYMEKTTGTNEVVLLKEGNSILRNITHQELPPVAEVHWNGAREWDAPCLRIDSSIASSFRAGENSPVLHAHIAELLNGRLRNFLHRYTDGSKALGRIGFGVSDPGRCTFFRLPEQCSVFSAEAAAIHHAVTTPTDKPLCILTDSASVLAALKSPVIRHPWIQGIQMSAPPNTIFLWIPGHCGIRGNVEADHLAAIGRRGRMATTSVPGPDVKKWTKSILREAWASEWVSRTEPFIRKVKGETTKWTDIPNWRDQRVLSRSRSGHTRVTHTMERATSFRKKCDTCGVTMTVEHIVINCPCFQGIRDLHGIPSNIRDALGNDPSIETALLGFIKDARLYADI